MLMSNNCPVAVVRGSRLPPPTQQLGDPPDIRVSCAAGGPGEFILFYTGSLPVMECLFPVNEVGCCLRGERGERGSKGERAKVRPSLLTSAAFDETCTLPRCGAAPCFPVGFKLYTPIVKSFTVVGVHSGGPASGGTWLRLRSLPPHSSSSSACSEYKYLWDGGWRSRQPRLIRLSRPPFWAVTLKTIRLP